MRCKYDTCCGARCKAGTGDMKDGSRCISYDPRTQDKDKYEVRRERK